MDTNEKSSDQTQADERPQDWLFDAFSEPRTMPTAWDLSAMEGSVKAPGNNGPAHAAAHHEPGDEGAADNQNAGETALIKYLDPFPAPRTYPSW